MGTGAGRVVAASPNNWPRTPQCSWARAAARVRQAQRQAQQQARRQALRQALWQGQQQALQQEGRQLQAQRSMPFARSAKRAAGSMFGISLGEKRALKCRSVSRTIRMYKGFHYCTELAAAYNFCLKWWPRSIRSRSRGKHDHGSARDGAGAARAATSDADDASAGPPSPTPTRARTPDKPHDTTQAQVHPSTSTPTPLSALFTLGRCRPARWVARCSRCKHQQA